MPYQKIQIAESVYVPVKMFYIQFNPQNKEKTLSFILQLQNFLFRVCDLLMFPFTRSTSIHNIYVKKIHSNSKGRLHNRKAQVLNH